MFLVVDNAFNRENYRELIGKTFVSPPGYASVLRVNPTDILDRWAECLHDWQPNHILSRQPVNADEVLNVIGAISRLLTEAMQLERRLLDELPAEVKARLAADVKEAAQRLQVSI